MNASSKGVYFPGLNGLRFVAAFLVIISHVEEMKLAFGYQNWRKVPTIENIGAISVTFFFVLSGFLITYLLLDEKKRTQWVCLTDFYSKRIVRIWPLYYLIVILGIFVIPHLGFMTLPSTSVAFTPKVIALFALILPNAVFGMYGFTPYTVQTWSIGVEEQFYILWPLLFRFSSRYLRAMVLVMASYFAVLLLLKAGIVLTGSMPQLSFIKTDFLLRLLNLVSLSRIDCMAIGGIGAWLVFENKHQWLAIVYHPVVVACTGLVLAGLMLTGTIIPIVGHRMYAILFIIVILNISTKPGKLTRMLENPVLNYLGKISYGIYMYHFIVIGLVIALLRNNLLSQPMTWLSHTVFYVLIIGLTIGVSALSYHGFEYKFIRARARWLSKLEKKTKIHSLRPYLKEHLWHRRAS